MNYEETIAAIAKTDEEFASYDGQLEEERVPAVSARQKGGAS